MYMGLRLAKTRGGGLKNEGVVARFQRAFL